MNMMTFSVLLLGPSGSGKTTFLANLYDYFIKNDRSDHYEIFEKEKGTIPYLAKIHEEYVKSGSCEATTEAISLLFEINAIRNKQRMRVKVTDVPGDADADYLTAETIDQQDIVLFFIDAKETSEEYKSKTVQKVKKLKNRRVPILLVFNETECSGTDTDSFVEQHYKQIGDLDKMIVSDFSKGIEIENIVQYLFEKSPSPGKTQKESKRTVMAQVSESEEMDKRPKKGKKTLLVSMVLLISLVGIVVVWMLLRGKPVQEVFAVMVQPMDGGTVTITPEKERYENGEKITIHAHPLENYNFSGWAGDVNGDNPNQEMSVTSDMTVKALFKPYFTLEIEKTVGGIVTAKPEKEKYEEGELITLYAQPSKFYEFMGWSGDLSVKSTTTGFYINKNMEIKAIFKHISQAQTYRIDIECYGDGIVVVVPQKDQYMKDEVVSLMAKPAENTRFLNWSVDLSGSNPYQIVKITRDLNIKAYFLRQ